MTQAMQFSSFKGPFAERIDVWNAKLYMVSVPTVRTHINQAVVAAVSPSLIRPEKVRMYAGYAL